MDYLLEVKQLQTVFQTEQGEVTAVDGVTICLKHGETIGIVGESGCGKSVTALSIMKLLGKNGQIRQGEIFFDGSDLVHQSEQNLRSLRGKEISMIFQETMTSLNPLFTIGNQLTETILRHTKLTRKSAVVFAIDMLIKVGIPLAKSIMNSYPHTLSGGMRQRVMIAMALACNPKLLIADEPTTALDVTIQAQILDLMKRLREESNMAMLLITHDLGVVAEMADKVIVMYAGQIVEETDVFTLFKEPLHPYTKGLMKSIPRLEDESDERLTAISGTVPSFQQMPSGCRFHTRCEYADDRCLQKPPELKAVRNEHWVRCWIVEDSELNQAIPVTKQEARV